METSRLAFVVQNLRKHGRHKQIFSRDFSIDIGASIFAVQPSQKKRELKCFSHSGNVFPLLFLSRFFSLCLVFAWARSVGILAMSPFHLA